MNTRFVGVAVALLLIGGIITVSQRLGKHTNGAAPTPTPFATASTSVGPNCLPVPKPAATPSWFPSDLPLPPGSYAFEAPKVPGQQRANFVINASLTDFVRFLLREWKARGWNLGRGDAEPGEADDSFRSADGRRVGAFKARSIYCDPSLTFSLFVVVNVTPSPTPRPS